MKKGTKLSQRTRRLEAAEANPKAGGAAFLQRVEALKQCHGGGVDFGPACLDFVPYEPFG